MDAVSVQEGDGAGPGSAAAEVSLGDLGGSFGDLLGGRDAGAADLSPAGALAGMDGSPPAAASSGSSSATVSYGGSGTSAGSAASSSPSPSSTTSLTGTASATPDVVSVPDALSPPPPAGFTPDPADPAADPGTAPGIASGSAGAGGATVGGDGVAGGSSGTSAPAPAPGRGSAPAASGAVPSGTTDDAAVRQQVEVLFERVLGRPADPGGLAAYTGALLSGALTLPQAARSMANSPEAQGDLHRLYGEALGRPIDPQGDATWTGALSDGALSLMQVRQAVARSDETRNTLRQMIIDVQGRQPTAADQPWLDAQIAALAVGSTTLAQIRQGLADFSGEAGVVTRLYQDVVGRDPSTDEIVETEQRLAAGTSLQTIRDADASSPEAVQHEAGSVAGQVTLISKGITYALPAWHLQEISYTKRSDVSREDLRAAFSSSVRGAYLKNLASTDRAALEAAGLSSAQIDRMAAGRNPQGYDVHHILPLDDGGTNDFSNLVLIPRSPDHLLLTNYQNNVTAGMQAAETRTIEWPVPDQPAPVLPAGGGSGAVPVAASGDA